MATNPLIVALGRSVPLNHSVTVQQIAHGMAEGQFDLRPDMMRPRLFWPSNRKRTSITISVPTDGKEVYIGGDSSVTRETGALLPPGQTYRITAYYGPIWIIAEAGQQKVFVAET